MNFKEIRLIRVLLWILFYLITLFLFIFLLVIPAVKRYKEIHGALLSQKATYRTVKQEYDRVSKRLEKLRHDHKKVIEAFESRWDRTRFEALAKRYFSSVSLKPVDTNDSDPHFKIYEVDARVQMSSPQNFYRFIDALPTLPFAIQADFPIAFRSVGGDTIDGIFRIKVYEEKRASVDSNASKPPVSKR